MDIGYWNVDLRSQYDYHMVMITINTVELKTHLGRYLRKVRKGETIDVTSHSHPVAKIVPYAEKEKPLVIEPTRSMEELKSITGIKTRIPIDAVQILLEDRGKR